MIMLPDWDVMVSQRYGVRRAARLATVAVVDAGSHLAGISQREYPVSATLDFFRREDQTTELEGPPAT
ncbi:hypothetical protein [Rubrobacter calidifluminis]|uniref:hypothetical protein n=1 Tax=Rubrobacter calidifluminis TaxID=1392640 RepID=UPI00236244F2|nr:hypothetical protein [Rubrobacter calidifluminis]